MPFKIMPFVYLLMDNQTVMLNGRHVCHHHCLFTLSLKSSSWKQAGMGLLTRLAGWRQGHGSNKGTKKVVIRLGQVAWLASGRQAGNGHVGQVMVMVTIRPVQILGPSLFSFLFPVECLMLLISFQRRKMIYGEVKV